MTRKPAPFDPMAGPPVSGSAFFDREAELASLDKAIGTGGKVFLVGPRRSGKTSLLHQTRIRLEKSSRRADTLYFDMSGAGAAETFERLLAAAMQPRREPHIPSAPEALLEQLQSALRARASPGDRPLVLLLDEIAAPLPTDDREKQLWRDLFAAIAGIADVTLIAALDTRVFNALGLGATAGKFQVIRIRPWNPDMVRRAASAWAAAERMPSQLIDAIVERVSPAWPMELMRLLLEIQRHDTPDERGLDELIDRIARDIPYEEIIHRLGSAVLRKRDEDLLHLILTALAQIKEGATAEDIAEASKQRAQPSEIMRLAHWLADLDLISLDTKSHRLRVPTGLAWRSLRHGLGLPEKTA